MKQILVQILVVVANTEVRTFRTEVEKGESPLERCYNYMVARSRDWKPLTVLYQS